MSTAATVCGGVVTVSWVVESNVTPVAAISEIEELNIGHSVVSRAVFVGMERAVREMLDLVLSARSR